MDVFNKINNKNLYIVSDLHMGDWTDKDNFKDFRPEFERFLDYVERDPDYCLILNGDVFELWQSSIGDILRNYFDLLNRIVNMNSIFIVGNHDIDLQSLIGLNLKNNFIDSLSSCLIVERNGKHIRIMHGHEFDKFNDPKKSMLLGKISALAAGWIEMQIGTTLGEKSTETILDKIAMFFVNLFSSIYRNLNKTSSENKNKETFYSNLIEYHNKCIDNIIITGHTHDAGIISDWYFNSGSWQKKSPYFIAIDKSGSIIIRKWPSCEQVFKNLLS